MAMFAVAQYVFAVSGIRMRAGEKEKNNATRASGAFSDLKSTVTFSIKDNYTFNHKNSGKTEFNLSSSGQARQSSSIISYKKGNTVYIMPYKPQSGFKLPGFIRMNPCESASR